MLTKLGGLSRIDPILFLARRCSVSGQTHVPATDHQVICIEFKFAAWISSNFAQVRYVEAISRSDNLSPFCTPEVERICRSRTPFVWFGSWCLSEWRRLDLRLWVVLWLGEGFQVSVISLCYQMPFGGQLKRNNNGILLRCNNQRSFQPLELLELWSVSLWIQIAILPEVEFLGLPL